MIKRALSRLVHARKPTFIMSPAFLKPDGSVIVKLHRRLLLASCRHPVRLLLNVIAILRWMGYYTWILSYKACKTRSEAQLQAYGLTRLALFRELVKLGLMNGISPRYYFKYQFYKPEQAKQKLNFIYQQELPYLHDYSNRHFKQYQQAARFMSDKYQFSAALQAIGVPTVESSLYTLEGLDPCWLLQKKTLFCKPNNASHSKDAFLIEYSAESDTYQINPVQGKTVFGRRDIDCYLKTIMARHRSLLIQPLMTDHPEIKKFSSHSATTTVRIITAKADVSPHIPPVLLYLQLEIPLEKQANTGEQFYNIIPLDLFTLDVDNTYQNKPWTLEKHNVMPSDTLKMLLRQGIDYCLLAHQRLLHLNTVSFDVIIGEVGPVILEANYNWSVEALYNVMTTNPLSPQDMHPAAQWLNTVIVSNP